MEVTIVVGELLTMRRKRLEQENRLLKRRVEKAEARAEKAAAAELRQELEDNGPTEGVEQ